MSWRICVRVFSVRFVLVRGHPCMVCWLHLIDPNSLWNYSYYVGKLLYWNDTILIGVLYWKDKILMLWFCGVFNGLIILVTSQQRYKELGLMHVFSAWLQFTWIFIQPTWASWSNKYALFGVFYILVGNIALHL